MQCPHSNSAVGWGESETNKAAPLFSSLFLLHCPRAYVLKRRYGEEGRKERERGKKPPIEREEVGNG